MTDQEQKGHRGEILLVEVLLSVVRRRIRALQADCLDAAEVTEYRDLVEREAELLRWQRGGRAA